MFIRIAACCAIALCALSVLVSDETSADRAKFARMPDAANYSRLRESDRHPFEGFTQPFQSIDVAVSDTGRVAEVGVARGAIVSKGDVLLRLDSSILQSSRRVAQAQANAIARIKALETEYAAQQARLAQYLALEESGRGSSEEILRAETDEQVALFNLDAAKEDKVAAQLAVDEIDSRIAARSVVSPIDGIVTDVKRDPGEFVSLSQPDVATIVDLTRLRATFFLPTATATRFSASDSVRLVIPETSQTITAIVEHVGATTEADSGRVRFDVLIDNAKRRVRSGLRCVLQVGARNDR